jgi:hypothetical protein
MPNSPLPVKMIRIKKEIDGCWEIAPTYPIMPAARGWRDSGGANISG